MLINPNVGAHLVEQRMISYQARINKDIGYTRQLRSLLGKGWVGMKYLATRKGIIAQGGYDIGAFVKTLPSSENTDGFVLMNPLSMDLANPGMNIAREPGFSAIAYPLHLAEVTRAFRPGGEATPPGRPYRRVGPVDGGGPGAQPAGHRREPRRLRPRHPRRGREHRDDELR